MLCEGIPPLVCLKSPTSRFNLSLPVCKACAVTLSYNPILLVEFRTALPSSPVGEKQVKKAPNHLSMLP